MSFICLRSLIYHEYVKSRHVLPGWFPRQLQAARRLAAIEWENSELIFTTRYGDGILPRTVDRAFKTLVAKADVPDMAPHDLRRTHSTLLIAAGVDPATMAKRLGHSDPTITLGIYTNVTPDMDVGLTQRGQIW